MRGPFRRHALAAGLITVGIAVVLAGTAASLAHARTAGGTATAAPAAAFAERSDGVALRASLDVDSPLAPLDPLTLHAEPGAFRALPLPGASLAREVDLDRANLGVDARLSLAAGGHRARTPGTPETVGVATQRATLTPATVPLAAAAAAFTLAGLGVYFWGALKAWATRLAVAPAIALYAKISRAEVFDNGVRERIFAAIRDAPGLSASDLARVASVSWGTTIYHLDVLEQTRMVTSLRKGRYRRYFENGAALTQSKDVVALLRNPVTAGVADIVRRTPGATQKELAAAASMSPQALHWHLARLVEAGAIRKEREGRVVRHFCL